MCIRDRVGSAETQTYYAPVGTIVQELHVKEGDEVHKGEVLVTFDTADLDVYKRQGYPCGRNFR